MSEQDKHTIEAILKAHQSEQRETAVGELAEQVAAYYRALIAYGVPADTAGQLSVAYQNSMFGLVQSQRLGDSLANLFKGPRGF